MLDFAFEMLYLCNVEIIQQKWIKKAESNDNRTVNHSNHSPTGQCRAGL